MATVPVASKAASADWVNKRLFIGFLLKNIDINDNVKQPH
jgi:hypothetical protein